VNASRISLASTLIERRYNPTEHQQKQLARKSSFIDKVASISQ